MIDHADILLRQIFLREIDEIVDEAQVRFEPPNSDWRTYVSTLTAAGDPANALNVFLWDARENRALRSNARERRVVNGLAVETIAARQLDCHYIVSAWSPAAASAAIEPALAEHRLLHDAASALMRLEPPVASEIFAPTPLPPGFPAEIADVPLPIVVGPADAPVGASEFWSTMGEPWRPSLHVVLTLPVSSAVARSGHIASTTITRLRGSVHDAFVEAEDLVLISGRVVDEANPGPDGEPAPIAGAMVRIGTLAGATFRMSATDDAGRFSFHGLTAGSYRLSVHLQGRGSVSRDVDVPSLDGDYEIAFS